MTANRSGSNRSASNSNLVYSTDRGRMCGVCRQALAQCSCKLATQPKGDGIVRVGRESKGRGGKSVTLVRGVPLDATALAALGKQLRTACGTGGTLKDGVLEVQGDHVEQVMEMLVQKGFVVKRVGG